MGAAVTNLREQSEKTLKKEERNEEKVIAGSEAGNKWFQNFLLEFFFFFNNNGVFSVTPEAIFFLCLIGCFLQFF
jgi:hypothetical protein